MGTHGTPREWKLRHHGPGLLPREAYVQPRDGTSCPAALLYPSKLDSGSSSPSHKMSLSETAPDPRWFASKLYPAPR